MFGSRRIRHAADQQAQETFFWGLIFVMVSPWMVES